MEQCKSEVGFSPDVTGQPDNRRLLFYYAAPYFAYVALGSLTKDLLAPEWDHTLKIVVVLALLAVGWRKYAPITGPRNAGISVIMGLAGGVAGTALWVVLMLPFAAANMAPWSKPDFLFRLVSAGLLVPVFEELLMRGYVLRLAVQWDRGRKIAGPTDALARALHEQSINSVRPGEWTVNAVLISSVVFALGHDPRQWAAAVAYGVLMAALWITRRDILSCIVAHGTTNILLALYVWTTGQWALW